jgi:hypothetical protein
MRTAGWKEIDFDDLAVLSGASALFAYQPNEFRPKYAHLSMDPDGRIADATGFGYEWVNFKGIDAAWTLLKASVDSGRPVKGWDWENILFAGYQDAARFEDRMVYAMADGPNHMARWLNWAEFTEWVDRIEGWRSAQLGRFAARVETKPAQEIAVRVMKDLVEWSINPPQKLRNQYPKAAFGLDGIEAYAAHCADVDQHPNWEACHDVNGQWTLRNSSSVYLKRVVKANLFAKEINLHLIAAADAYRAAYQSWQELYQRLGHNVTDVERMEKENRLAGATAVRQGLAHEKAGIGYLDTALSLLHQENA